MSFTLTTVEDGKLKFKNPRLLADELERLGKLGQSKFREDWEENLRETSGFLEDSTLDHQVKVVGSSLLHNMVNENRYGDPVPYDVLRSTLARYLGRLMSLMGGVQGIASTSEQEDIDQAEAVEKVLQNKWDNEDLDVAAMNAAILSLNCSHGYILVEGDPTLKPPSVYEDRMGFGLRETKVGDVIYDALSPFQVYMPPGTTKLKDAAAILVIQFMDAQTIKRRWPGMKVDKAGQARYDSKLDELVPGLGESMLKVRRLFIKGNPQKKTKGRQYVIIGQKTHIVRDKAGKRWIGTYDNEYPLIDFMDEPLRVGYYGRGRHTHARPALKTLCSAWTKIAKIMALPIVLGLPDGSGLGIEDFKDVPFIVANLLPGAANKPEFIAPTGLEWHFRTMEEAKRQIMEVYSQHEPSKGKSPGSRFSAQGIERLQAADRLGDSAAGKLVMKAMTRLLQRVLGEGLVVWPEEYDAIVLGRENSYKRHVLRKAELKPGIDVRVIPGEEEPKTKNVMMREVTEALRHGMLDPPEARRIMGAGRSEDMYNPNDHHMRKIKMEDKLIEMGHEVDIFPEDNHELHIPEHEKRNIERAFEAEPDELERRRRHIEEHLKTAQPEGPPPDPAVEAQKQELAIKQQEMDLKTQGKQQDMGLDARKKLQEMDLYARQKEQEMALRSKEAALKRRESRAKPTKEM
jgi:hypothetical protein